jgi:hypothetical protein
MIIVRDKTNDREYNADSGGPACTMNGWLEIKWHNGTIQRVLVKLELASLEKLSGSQRIRMGKLTSRPQ